MKITKVEKKDNKWNNNYNPLYYYPNKLLSFNPEIYWFYICIGSRGRGKTVSAWRWVLKRFLKHNEKFIWLRLTASPLIKASRNKGTTLVPQFLLKQLKITAITMRGSVIYITTTNDKGEQTTRICGLMDSISTFYTSKGQDMSDYTNVVFDEINRESGEKTTFDITRAFINQIETIARFRKIRVLMLGNTILDTSEILGIFNFQPKEFGIYKLTRKHAIIEYLDDSVEFKEQRKDSLAGVLLGDNHEASASFTNKTKGYDDNLVKYNNKRMEQIFLYHIAEFKIVGIYRIKKKSKLKDIEGLYIGEPRIKNQIKYRISPFLNCEGIYDKEIYNTLFNLLSSNKLHFETPLIRTRFNRAMKLNKTTLV